MHIYTSFGQYRISMCLQYCPKDVQTTYVPWAIQDFHASIVRPLGRIGYSCIHTSLGPYRIYMQLYVPWAVQDFHASIRPLGHIGFTCIYTSLGPYRRPIWPDIFANFILYKGCITVGGVYIPKITQFEIKTCEYKCHLRLLKQIKTSPTMRSHDYH